MVETGFYFLISQPPARRTVMPPNLTTMLPKLAVIGSSTLDLILQMYSYDTVGEGVPRHMSIPGSALEIFKHKSRQRIYFSRYCLKLK